MPGNILIVDDEIINRKLLTILLKNEDYNFFHAADGLQALEIVESEEIDLIILDIMMPRMDGYQFMEAYNEKYPPPRIPIIVSSAVEGNAGIERALKMGAADYFRKPLSEEVKKLQLPIKARNLIQVRQLRKNELEKKKMEAVMAIAGTANHEINQPLQVILGNLQLMLIKYKDNPDLTRQLKMLEEHTLRIAGIVRKIGNINTYATKEYVDDSHIIDLTRATDTEDAATG